MLKTSRYFLSAGERHQVEQTLVENGFHFDRDLLELDDEQIVLIYQKIQVEQLMFG